MTAARHDRTKARYFVPAFVAGWLIIAFGVQSALSHADDAHPFSLLVFIVLFDLAHDVVIAPIVIAGAWFIERFVPRVAHGPVRLAASATIIIVAFAYPLIRRWGQRPTNSSTLPLEYGRNVAIIVAIVWVAAAVVVAVRIAGKRSAGEAESPAGVDGAGA